MCCCQGSLVCCCQGSLMCCCQGFAELNKIAMVVGYPEAVEPDSPDDQPLLYNSIAVVNAAGELLANCRKSHFTHGFAVFDRNPSTEHFHVFTVGGCKIAVLWAEEIVLVRLRLYCTVLPAALPSGFTALWLHCTGLHPDSLPSLPFALWLLSAFILLSGCSLAALCLLVSFLAALWLLFASIPSHRVSLNCPSSSFTPSHNTRVSVIQYVCR